MPIQWPGISSSGGTLDEEKRTQLREALDKFGELLEGHLADLGLPPWTHPLFKPWNLYVIVDAEKVMFFLTALSGGIATIRWLDYASEIIPFEGAARDIQQQTGQQLTIGFSLSKAVLENIEDELLEPEAQRQAVLTERDTRLSRLGDLSGVEHLEGPLRRLLDDHPDPDRNVFIMMRFLDTNQMNSIAQTIKSALTDRDLVGLRADDRDYTGELWSNVQTYMTASRFGIAVFEDIEERHHNPNVALELGYMLARQKRCLILKEQRLDALPTDLIGKLYKPFDVFNIDETVRAQVHRWTDVDLRGILDA